MVLTVVNLQEAYAKALLVDRDALRAAAAGRRRARRPRGAARRLPAPTSGPLCAEARAALGAAEDPIARAARVRLRRRAMAAERETAARS